MGASIVTAKEGDADVGCEDEGGENIDGEREGAEDVGGVRWRVGGNRGHSLASFT